MANMSYCRFRNTLLDLQDAYDNWHDLDSEENVSEELRARERLFLLCKEIASDLNCEQDDDDDEEEF